MNGNAPHPLALPTGTVSLLFTDIEGSTAMLRANPRAYAVAMLRHHALLREAVEANRGHVVETEGDAIFAAFARSTDAVAAALWGQLALQAEPWGESGPIKVRMGVHTGEVELYGAQYVGLAMHRAARLASTAHGGQVVLSEATAVHLRDALPHEAHLTDLGEHRLKDLTHPEHLFQLAHPELPASFPPLRSLDTLPNNLARQSTPFLGRERELAAVKSLLRQDDVRLLTLLGPGGTGKTRLALQVAADLLDEFRHGVFFVSLASVSDATLVPSAIAQALEVREETGTALEDTLQRYCREKQLLLVLDNFEQLTGAESWIAQLLSGAPGLRLLVTSRAALRVYGEREFPVPTLTLPDLRRLPPIAGLSQYESVRLFIDRARAILPDFAITNENAPAVAELCHRLDGLPLAIELAAARVRILPPQAMLDRIQHRLPLLTGGARDRPVRQQTLRAAIAWSYDLLAPEEQTLFRRLGVFRGCTLEAVEAVCCAPVQESGASSLTILPVALDALDGVSALLEQSLLERKETADGQLRYVMLETVREFALECLAGGAEDAAVRRRHALYFLRLAEAADEASQGPQQVVLLDRLEREHENLREALRWCNVQGYAEPALRTAAALWWFWYVRGHLTEGRDHLATLLARFPLRRGTEGGASGPRAALHARALRAAGHLAAFQGDLVAARALQEQALQLAEDAGDPAQLYDALAGLSFVARQQGDWAVARAYLERLRAEAQAGGNRMEPITYLYGLGSLAHDEGDLARARSFLEEGLRLLRLLEGAGSHLLGDYLLALGVVALDQGDHAYAYEAAEQARVLYEAAGDRRRSAVAQGTLGGIATARGDFPAAKTHLAASLRDAQGVGDPGTMAAALERFALLAVVRGEAARALRLAGAAGALREASGVQLPPASQAKLDASLAAAREALGAGDAEATHEAGQALSVEEAVAEALTPRIPPGE